jgi:hypothetical protein
MLKHFEFVLREEKKITSQLGTVASPGEPNLFRSLRSRPDLEFSPGRNRPPGLSFLKG